MATKADHEQGRKLLAVEHELNPDLQGLDFILHLLGLYQRLDASSAEQAETFRTKRWQRCVWNGRTQLLAQVLCRHVQVSFIIVDEGVAANVTSHLDPVGSKNVNCFSKKFLPKTSLEHFTLGLAILP